MNNIDKELYDYMTERGFTPMHTGGGCMTWDKSPLQDKGYLWICAEDSLGTWGQFSQPDWTVGRYNQDGDSWWCVANVTLEQALKIAGYLPVPQAGDEVILSFEEFEAKIS